MPGFFKPYSATGMDFLLDYTNMMYFLARHSSVIDSNASPLALLAQTCNNIGGTPADHNTAANNNQRQASSSVNGGSGGNVAGNSKQTNKQQQQQTNNNLLESASSSSSTSSSNGNSIKSTAADKQQNSTSNSNKNEHSNQQSKSNLSSGRKFSSSSTKAGNNSIDSAAAEESSTSKKKDHRFSKDKSSRDASPKSDSNGSDSSIMKIKDEPQSIKNEADKNNNNSPTNDGSSDNNNNSSTPSTSSSVVNPATSNGAGGSGTGTQSCPAAPLATVASTSKGPSEPGFSTIAASLGGISSSANTSSFQSQPPPSFPLPPSFFAPNSTSAPQNIFGSYQHAAGFPSLSSSFPYLPGTSGLLPPGASNSHSPAAAAYQSRLCLDPFCKSCPIGSVAAAHNLVSQAAAAAASAGRPCPLGCLHCSSSHQPDLSAWLNVYAYASGLGGAAHAGLPSASNFAATGLMGPAALTPNFSGAAAPFAAAMAPYGQNAVGHTAAAAPSSAGPLPPPVCWWDSGDGFCLKRFANAEEFFQHLRTHALESAAGGKPSSLFAYPPLSSSFASHSIPPTSSNIAAGCLSPRSSTYLSTLAAASAYRYHPYGGKFGGLPTAAGPDGFLSNVHTMPHYAAAAAAAAAAASSFPSSLNSAAAITYNPYSLQSMLINGQRLPPTLPHP